MLDGDDNVSLYVHVRYRYIYIYVVAREMGGGNVNAGETPESRLTARVANTATKTPPEREDDYVTDHAAFIYI